MSKSIKFNGDTYLDSEGVNHSTRAEMYSRKKLSDLLPTGSNQSSLYSTNYLQLGYFECSGVAYTGWSTITLLISSTFYGVQHWSSHLVTIAQAGNIEASQIRIAGTSREIFYKNDSTNKRVYVYARCTGGNGFGHWSIAPLNIWNCNWVTEIVQNINYEDSWIQIGTIPELQQPVELWKKTNWDSMASNMTVLSLDLTPYKYIEVYFCSYGVNSTTDQKGGNALSPIIKIDLQQPSINNIARYQGIDWRYGNAYTYPDVQLMFTDVQDPYFFNGAALVSADKQKIFITNLGFIDQYFVNNPTSGQYVRAWKIVGYK